MTHTEAITNAQKHRKRIIANCMTFWGHTYAEAVLAFDAMLAYHRRRARAEAESDPITP
tara:strand:+ start:362 stop:538 length:177 start_codon:yes stop_codon:yes gene_type:complete